MRNRVGVVAAALVLAACGPGEPVGSPTGLTATAVDADGVRSQGAAQPPSDGPTSTGAPLTAAPDGPEPGDGAGRGPSEPHASPPSGEGSPASAPAVRASPFDAAMLVIDDLPEGWEAVEEPERDEDDGSSRREDGDDGQGGPRILICGTADLADGIELDRAEDGAGAVFRRALWGPYATSLAATLPAGQVEAVLDELDSAGRSCRTWTQTDEDGNETIFTIAPFDPGDLGDQTVAFALTVQSGVIRVEMDLVLWRVGDVGAAMIHAGTVGSVERELSERLAVTVSRRLHAVLTA